MDGNDLSVCARNEDREKDFDTRMQLERGLSICIGFSLAITHRPMTASISSKGVYLFSPMIIARNGNPDAVADRFDLLLDYFLFLSQKTWLND